MIAFFKFSMTADIVLFRINTQLIDIVIHQKNNLFEAINGETFEFKKMYKSFIKNARKEDIFLAEYSFDLARKAEIVHSRLFKKYLEKLGKHKIFPPIEIYVCSICGHVELRNQPIICPICGHDEKFFKKIDLE